MVFYLFNRLRSGLAQALGPEASGPRGREERKKRGVKEEGVAVVTSAPSCGFCDSK